MSIDTSTTELAFSRDLEFGTTSVFLHRSAHRTVHARGVLARLPTHLDGGWETLADRVRACLAERGPGVPSLVVGALPFAADQPGELVLPASARRDDGQAAVPDPGGAPAISGLIRRREIPEPSDYAEAVRTALRRIGEGTVTKVVLARTVELEVVSIDIAVLASRLAARDPQAHTFAVRLPETGPDRRALVGASPELLVAKSGRTVTSHPLAGSAARCADPAEDRRRAEALLASAKNTHEHAVVVEMIAERLRPFCTALTVPSAPELVGTATMWHLGSRIHGRLIGPEVSAVDLATALHPTPAVCGTPTEGARSLIGLLESFDRGHYAGTVGWCDAAGDGEWVVALRCAEVGSASVRLFAGAGVVAGSDPAAELAETTAKLRTLHLALGLEGTL